MMNLEMIGSSPVFRAVLDDVQVVAPADCAVLIEGETGTGKEVIAQAIHEASPRRHHGFVAVNCAAIPAALLESELFGHERGAFTGAVAPQLGRFQAADHGTLFLDEIGELPIELQPKLLRANCVEIRREGFPVQTCSVPRTAERRKRVNPLIDYRPSRYVFLEKVRATPSELWLRPWLVM